MAMSLQVNTIAGYKSATSMPKLATVFGFLLQRFRDSGWKVIAFRRGICQVGRPR